MRLLRPLSVTCRACSLILVVAGLLASCSGREPEDEVLKLPVGDASYNFSEPDARFVLPPDLSEISGLALLDDGRIAAVQDEEGILYLIDPNTGVILEERTFGPPGDYEAVEFAAGRIYVLRSDGNLLRFDAGVPMAEEPATFELDIPSRCDAEGLRYDAEAGRLLVSCKDEPGPGYEIEKAIYAFDVSGRRLQDEPVYLIDSRRVAASIPDHPVNEAVRSVLSDRVDLSGFKPSELAIHPVTGELFVLSSVRDVVLALGTDGQVTGFWSLPSDLLNQSEGMVFLPNGDAFISSEAGNQESAVLMRFDYRFASEGFHEDDTLSSTR